MVFSRLGSSSRPSLKLGAGMGTERWAELTAYGIESEDGASSITGPFEGSVNRPHYLTGSAYQSIQSGSLWRFAWDNTGVVVPFRLAPRGNPVPTLNEPHYVGKVVVGPRPSLGGSSTDGTFIFEFVWRISGTPQQVTA